MFSHEFVGDWLASTGEAAIVELVAAEALMCATVGMIKDDEREA